ncbi:hypothetical protein EON63_09935 [archaeon]|nr:MAG: hypothetical protein EON63_09935 [archaeon]
MIGLCVSFESLLMETHPKLFLHLVGLGLQPLKVSAPHIIHHTPYTIHHTSYTGGVPLDAAGVHRPPGDRPAAAPVGASGGVWGPFAAQCGCCRYICIQGRDAAKGEWRGFWVLIVMVCAYVVV